MRMKDLNARDAKVVQYLNEAFGKEKELEQALEAHIGLTTRPTYRKRLQEHLRETKRHGDRVERRIKQLGGSATPVSLPGPDAVSDAAEAGMSVAQRALALARGPLHAIRGTSEQEKMLKNAKTEFSEEAHEIATYNTIEALANQVGDKETAKLAKEIRREEERMSKFLERLIPQLVSAVAKAEIPAALRSNGGTSRRRTTSRRTSAARSSSSRSSGGSRRTSARSGSSSRSSSGTSRTTKSRSGSSRATASRRATSSSRRATSARSGSSRSGSSSGRKTTARSSSARTGSSSRRRSSGS
jgi:ferritin-like metal-binding protein YciE